MSAYSVADAKNGLPGLIDRALAGEEVVITRHGKPVVELRPTLGVAADRPVGTAAHERLIAGRVRLKGAPITSVELLNQMYDEPND